MGDGTWYGMVWPGLGFGMGKTNKAPELVSGRERAINST